MKILHIDIETAPKLAYIWSVWKSNTYSEQLVSDTFMLTCSAKWDRDDTIYGYSLTPKEAKKQNDKRICKQLHKLMDEADIIVGHNLDKFDIPVINTRFLANNLPVPSPYRTVDTLKVVKRHFSFTYNKLDYVAKQLLGESKMDTGGFDLWSRCYNGMEKALAKMLEYNMQDVILLERVYHKLLPWIKTHPNMSLDSTDTPLCSKCGSDHLHKRGTAKTQVGLYQRYQCQSCGGWSRSRVTSKDKYERVNVLASAQ